jgi:hypothetical protein
MGLLKEEVKVKRKLVCLLFVIILLSFLLAFDGLDRMDSFENREDDQDVVVSLNAETGRGNK